MRVAAASLIAIAVCAWACASGPRDAGPASGPAKPATSTTASSAPAADRPVGPHAFPAAPALVVRPASTAPVVQLTAGPEHACARHSDGAVSCWGANALGQLGDPPRPVGTLAPVDKRDVRAFPAGGPLGDALEVATGAERTCVKRADGVWCWGSPAGDPYRIVDADDATDLTSRCGLDPGGGIRCWHDLLAADVEPEVGGVADVATDAYRTCVALRDRVTCWRHLPVSYEGEDVVKVKGVVQIAVAQDHRCAVTRRGDVWCWDGSDYYVTGRRHRGPTKIAIKGAAQVVVGLGFGCARKADGAVWCWGRSPSRPKNDVIDPARPERVADLVADELAAGNAFVCARTGGDVACFGENERGQLGMGWSHVRAAPTVVPGVAGALDVQVAMQRSCARLDTGAVTCWGRTLEKDRAAPAEVPELAGAVRIAGHAGACGVTAGGTIACQIAHEGGPGSAAGGVADLAVSETHSVAVLDDGTVVSWGGNSFGQFATGALHGSEKTEMPGVDDAIAVGVARDVTCLLHRGGAVSCAGRDIANDGRGRVVNQRLVEISGVARAIAIAVADDHACALIDGGTVACWGQGARGQLGSAMVGTSTGAVEIAGLDHVVQIAAGAGATCARRDDGSVVCWGDNETGLLGEPAAQAWSAEPVTLPIVGAVDLSVAEHACAALATGEVACWGRSDNGQVGTVRSGWITTPTRVTF